MNGGFAIRCMEDDSWSSSICSEKHVTLDGVTGTCYEEYAGGPAGGILIEDTTGKVYRWHTEWFKKAELEHIGQLENMEWKRPEGWTARMEAMVLAGNGNDEWFYRIIGE